MKEGRYAFIEGEKRGLMCEDCGVVVADDRVHDRFHAILNHHAKALAILKVAHLAAHVHDKYEVYDKIGNPEDSWSAEAFEEATGIPASSSALDSAGTD